MNCTNSQILLRRKWKNSVGSAFFPPTSIQSHKMGIKTLTLLTTGDCLETIRRLNIMATQGTFRPFKRKNLETKFEKGLLVSKTFSICFSLRVCVGFFPPF